MDLLFLIASILFFIAILRNLLQAASILHLSDYRLSLLFPTIKHLKHSAFYYLLTILKIIGMVSYLFAILDESLIYLFHYFVTVILFLESLLFIHELISKYHELSELTAKELFLIIPTVISAWFLFINPIVDSFFWLLLLSSFVTVIFFFYATAFSFPIEVFEDLQIEKAKKKREQNSEFPIIAIAGDNRYLVSKLVNSVLSTRIKTTAAKFSISKPAEAAQFINKKINNEFQTGIVKINSYYDGDFTAVLEILNPQIIIISDSINTFKKNKIDSYKKYEEIIDILPQNSFCIWHFSNDISKKKIKSIILRAKHKNINLLPVVTSSQINIDISILVNNIIEYQNIILNAKGLSFSLNLNKKKYNINSELLSEDSISGIISSLILAKNAGFNMKDTIRLIEKMESYPGYLAPYHLKNNAVILDNSAGITVGSLISAVNSLKFNNGKKTIIISSLFDLHDIHETDMTKLINFIFSNCECVVFLDKISYDTALKLYSQKKYTCMLMFENIPAVSELLNKVLINHEDIALLIGKETGILIERLKAEKRA